MIIFTSTWLDTDFSSQTKTNYLSWCVHCIRLLSLYSSRQKHHITFLIIAHTINGAKYGILLIIIRILLTPPYGEGSLTEIICHPSTQPCNFLKTRKNLSDLFPYIIYYCLYLLFSYIKL